MLFLNLFDQVILKVNQKEKPKTFGNNTKLFNQRSCIAISFTNLNFKLTRDSITTLESAFNYKYLVRVEGLEPPRLAAPEPKSGASTNFATPAFEKYIVFLETVIKRILRIREQK